MKNINFRLLLVAVLFLAVTKTAAEPTPPPPPIPPPGLTLGNNAVPMISGILLALYVMKKKKIL